MTGDDRPSGLPTRATIQPDGVYFEVRDLAPAALQDPFMHETVRRVPATASLVHVPPGEVGVAPPGQAPAGLIFHVARCGSTLVSQMLKRLEGLVVYSEPQPMNEILVPPHRHGRRVLVGALRSLGALFARHAGRPYILKLTSWNTLYCDLVAEAFPTTPWALCVRDPVEVCVSLLQHRPGWVKAAPSQQSAFDGDLDPTLASRTQEEYVARVQAALYRAVRRLDPARGRVIAYEDLPGAVWTTIGPHFGCAIDADRQREMSLEALGYAKAPVGKAAAFAPDAAAKRAAASPELRRHVDALVRDEMAQVLAAFREGRQRGAG